jgi:hypothetical protein
MIASSRLDILEFLFASGLLASMSALSDFNRHDQLWGGEDMTGKRQGEAGRIIDLLA